MRYPGIRRDERHGLARALQTAEYLPGFLERNADITVNLRQSPPEDQLVSLPDLIYPFSYDPLSAAFRTLSHNLTSLSVQGVFDGTLFWADDMESTETSNQPANPWRNLRYLRAELELSTPSGSWYFMPKDKQDYAAAPHDPVDTNNYPPTPPEEPRGGRGG